MAKRVIEENVVLTTFEINEAARQESIRKHRTYVTNIKKSYQELTTSMSNMAASFSMIVSQLDKSVKKLEQTNSLLAQKINSSLEDISRKYNNTVNKLNRGNRQLNNGFISLFRTVGTIEQALYRLSAGFFVVGFGVSKLLDDQRELYYLSQKLSIPVSDISKYGYVISQIGGDAEKARDSLNRFSQTLQDMARGQNAEALEVFGRLGISQFNSNGSIKSVSQAITEIKQKFSTIESTQTKINYLKKLGFDENEFNYFLNDVSFLEERFESIYNKITGLSSQDFLSKSTEGVTLLSNQIRTLNTTLNVTLQQLLYKLLPNLKYYVNTLQTKLLANNKNIVNTLQAFFKIIVDLTLVISSFANMILMFTGSIVDFWNNLDESQRKVIALGGAFVGFFKLFSSAMLSSPFGRFLTVLSMGLLLIEDYIYWKKKMEGENYDSKYDWSSVDKYIQSFMKLSDNIPNPFDKWNDSLLELLANVDTLTVAILSLIAAMSGTKIPKALGGALLKNPRLAGIAGLLIAGGLLIPDEKQGEDDKRSYFTRLTDGLFDKLSIGSEFIRGFFTDIFKDTEKGKAERKQLLFSSPIEYYDEAVRSKRFRDLEGLTKEEAQAAFKKEQDILYKIGPIQYLSSEAAIARQLKDKNFVPSNEYMQFITNSPLVDNTQQFIPKQNLGAEKGNINNNQEINLTKGNTTVNIYGNVDKENIDEITETINSDDFFKEMLSMENIFNNTQQLFKGK